LTDHLIDSLKDLKLELQTPEDKQCRSGIVKLKIRRPQKVAEKLGQKGIVVSAIANVIRVSPHFYNVEEENDRLTEEIKRFI
jgi:selenocysteine lyase/cysteine desulfurase